MRGALVIAFVLLSACNREPDFSERYDAASKKIGASAGRIDAELEKRAKQAGETANPDDLEPAKRQDDGSRPPNGP